MAVPIGAGRHRAPDFDNARKVKMARENSPFTPSESGSRSSFSSVRENDDGLAQTFTRSKVSSYIDAPEEVFDESPSAEIAEMSFRTPITQPHSRLHGFWYPPDSFKGWKEIPLKGKAASRSCEDLRRLGLTWESAPVSSHSSMRRTDGRHSVGQAPLETLPSEILGSIIDLLVVEIPPNGLTTRNTDLMALLLTSRSVHATTLETLYRHITIPHSRIFRKFLNTIREYPALATIVRRLDFSHFNPSMLFSTASERAQTQNLTTETLAQCLELTPFLKEFLAQEYVDADLGFPVLQKLFMGLPQLTALDFCGCSSVAFKSAFSALLNESWPETLPITRLSLHKCLGLPSTVFRTILPRLPNLTHLDVAGTRITDDALENIPTTARLTHVNLAKCKELSSEVVINFVTSHSATRDTLVFLSLATDPTNHLLLGTADIDKLLPKLPKSLKSLNLRGSRMNASHIPELSRLAQSLEELAVGRGLELNDVEKHVLGDAPLHNLRYLDISDTETMVRSNSELLRADSAPLLVIEMGERAYEVAAKMNKSFHRVGWAAKDFGSRYWLVRGSADGMTRDNGARWWKMGAESWGMRKIPVAVAEVGGMYGSFMFGRRL